METMNDRDARTLLELLQRYVDAYDADGMTVADVISDLATSLPVDARNDSRG